MSPAEPQCDISVVLVSWNTAEMIGDALDAVRDACHPYLAEVIVIDNASEDGSVDLLRSRAEVRLVTLERNTGFTHAANLGARDASGRYLLFLNPDLIAPPGSVAGLVDALEFANEAWAATPWFRNPDGTPQYFWRRLLGTIGLPLCFTRWGKRLDRLVGQRFKHHRAYRDLPDPPPRMAIDTVGAACLLVRREEFEHEGGFDERYFNFFQDTELVRRMRRRGRSLLGVGDIDVTHQMGVTFRRLAPWEVDAQMLRALRQYLSGEPWLRRVLVDAAVRFDLILPGPHRRERRQLVMRPLEIRG